MRKTPRAAHLIASTALVLVVAVSTSVLASVPVTSGLQVWLNAESGTSSTTDGSTLTSWTDAQNSHVFGNANALLPTYVADAGGGLPAIDFRRSSGFTGDFSSTAGATLGDATVFVIGKFGGYTHGSGSSSYWFSIDSSTGQPEHTLGRDHHTVGPDSLYHWRAQPSPVGYYGTNIVETDNDFNYFTAVYRGGGGSGNGMAAWINGSAGLAGAADVSTAGNDVAYGADPAKTRVGLWTSNGSGLDGQIRELLIYDRILSPTEVNSVESYLSGRVSGDTEPPPPPPEEFLFKVDLSGQPNGIVAGFVPHGDPEVTGTAMFTIREDNTMDYNIVLSDDRYRVTQAHFYNINKTSGTSGNPAHGDSIICWGGRWENNAAGGDSSEFLDGHGYTNGRLGEVLASPEDWALILHTEGGHFALDGSGNLIVYDPDRSGPQETSVTGVPESERASRFNNRVGKTLLDLVLREDNTNDPGAPFHDPNAPGNQNATPFADADGNLWVEDDGNGGYQLTAAALSRGYDLTTEYLFYLYDDQGPSWDFGGPEGAMTGFLQMISACNPGDTDDDGDIDTVDLTTSISNFNGVGGTGKGCEHGDTDDDGDVDTVDLTFSISNFTGALAGDPNVPDLIYNPADGTVLLDTEGQDVISFSLQGGPFNTGATDFGGLPPGLSDNIANQIGWTSFNIGGGLVGTADLGAILPAGLTEAQFLAALAGGANYGLSVVTGGGGALDPVYLPEPASIVLMGLGAVALLRRRHG